MNTICLKQSFCFLVALCIFCISSTASDNWIALYRVEAITYLFSNNTVVGSLVNIADGSYLRGVSLGSTITGDWLVSTIASNYVIATSATEGKQHTIPALEGPLYDERDALNDDGLLCVICNPARYLNKKIQVEGYLHLKDMDERLYISKESADYMQEGSALEIDLQCESKRIRELVKQSFDCRFVVIDGVLERMYYEDTYCLSRITRIQEIPRFYDGRKSASLQSITGIVWYASTTNPCDAIKTFGITVKTYKESEVIEMERSASNHWRKSPNK